jgi:hypothetical protein
MKRILRHTSLMAVVTTILSFASPLAHGQATISVTNITPDGVSSLKPLTNQNITFQVNWTGFPGQQNVPIDIYCEIWNVTKNTNTGKVKILTVYSGGIISSSTGGAYQGALMRTPDGASGDQGTVRITAMTTSVPGNPFAGSSATPTPYYE